MATTHLQPKVECTGCHRTLPIGEFRIDRTKPRGRATRCKSCSEDASAVRFARNEGHRAEAIEQGHAKACRTCSDVKPISDFPANKCNLGGSSHECTACFELRHAKWRSANKDHVQTKARKAGRRVDPVRRAAALKRHRLKKNYGLTQEQVATMRDLQNGACAICRTPFCDTAWGGDAMNIDHDHATGSVRGLLCTNCNKGLGHFKDRTDYLRRAIDYLGVGAPAMKVAK